MSKRVTSKDIARLAGVSRTTVSFVLNNTAGMRISEDTRQRVLDAVKQLNYHPDQAARSMASGRQRILGFVVRQSADQAFADLFLPQVLNGLTKAAGEQGYRVIFEPIAPEDHGDSYGLLTRTRHVDGIILSGPRSDDRELIDIHEEGAHVVLMGQLPDSGIPLIDVDNVGGAELATRHLIELGHRRIALITNALPAYTASIDRRAGYQQALEGAGIAYDESLVRYGNLTPHSGDEAMTDLLGTRERPTAVFVASDTVALGAMQAVRRQGLRVPQDIALVSFDDIPLAEFVDPPLSTIHLPAYALGWGAADMLLQLIEGEEPLQKPNVILETELIVRESCGSSFKNRTK